MVTCQLLGFLYGLLRAARVLCRVIMVLLVVTGIL